MKPNQISTILNEILSETTGESAIVAEDLSNIVDVGKTVPDFTKSLDTVFNKIIDKVGKTIVETRKNTYKSLNISVDDWVFGGILEKIRIDIPDASDNKSWSLTSGQSYDCFKFTPPNVRVKYYTKFNTFNIEMSFTDLQLRTAFQSPESLTSFWSGVENAITKAIESYTILLEYRCVNNFIGLKIHNNNNVVNLLKLWNDSHTEQLTADKCLSNGDFCRFCTKTIKTYSDYISELSMLYNDDGYVTSTADEDKKLILITDFIRSIESNAYSSSFNVDYVKIDDYISIPSWQASGTEPTFTTRTSIDVKVDVDGVATEVKKSGIVGVLFDKNGCCVCKKNYRVTSMPVPSAEFINYWYKFDGMYINDTSENCVVFTIEDVSA